MNVTNIAGIEIFNSIYEYLDSNMYVIFPCEGEAIIVDPHVDTECLSLLKERKVSRVFIILTHEHTDHTSGIYWYHSYFESKLICQKNCAVHISDIKKMRPLLISFVLEEHDRENGTHYLEKFKSEYCIRTYKPDITFDNSYYFTIGCMNLHFVHIPGHSKGSTLIVVNDKIAFTGDSLMRFNPVITRFPGSDHKLYIEYTLPILSSLPKEIVILPGHGDTFPLNELIVDGKLNIDYK